MDSKSRIKYAEEMLKKGWIESSDEYMKLIKGSDIEQLEEKIKIMQQYLLYKKLNLVSDYSQADPIKLER